MFTVFHILPFQNACQLLYAGEASDISTVLPRYLTFNRPAAIHAERRGWRDKQ